MANALVQPKTVDELKAELSNIVLKMDILTAILDINYSCKRMLVREIDALIDSDLKEGD